MYLAIVSLTMFILPVASVLGELSLHPESALTALIGKWVVFWAVGARLSLAGLRQFFQPTFTAREIFHLEGDEALLLVRELGVANLAAGVVGLLSIRAPTFVVPSAVSAGIFYGIAGVRHVFERGRSFNENVAMVSDLAAFIALAAFLTAAVLGGSG
jgi:hypothetical protein